MALPEHRLWIGGQEVSGKGELIPVENPATSTVFAHCHSASPEDVNNAILLSYETFKSGVWAKSDRHTRADVLERAAQLLANRLPELIELEVLQTGRVIREMNAQVPSLVKWFKYFAALLRTEERAVLPTTGQLHNWVDRKPIGVCIQITPFNHPLLICVKKLAPALAAGNSVIVKPSELTPLSTLLLGKIMKEAGLPNGVLSVLPGYGISTGKALVDHPLVKKVDITGGTLSGRAIGSIAGANLSHFVAELGGKAPVVVTKHANIDLAVNGVAFGAFIASGQTCVAATRIIVEKSILPQFLVKLESKALSITRRMGSPTNFLSTMGPLISNKQLDIVTSLVDDAAKVGLVIKTGGSRLLGSSQLDGSDFSSGYFYPPTIITDGENAKVPETRIWKEEAFGPVIVVIGFDTEEEALELANDSEFGLGAAVWTEDLSQAYRLSDAIESGICWINTHHRNDPSSPWGGIGSSGLGTENGVDAFRAYTTSKSIILNYAPTNQALANDDWFGEEAGQVRYG
ncbi:hypothetical protein M433DRAFT_152199 [Acidomyces richmondensis BFW]|nr:MAG: hypothetical protein FE78DRAFT_86926 [Acidomyces sp. 'richmondensis']KYG47504.1 hypothetical protein M433DRAFT_152199 [Acidomyces richmondensis BFW]